jgi:hypothetical protein
MTAAAPEARKPRRKWGWLFLIAFLVQAWVFVGLIAHRNSDLNRTRSLEAHFIKQGVSTVIERNRIRSVQTEMNLYMAALGIVSIITLAGTVIGLRRRK